MGIRINKWLADHQYASRREADAFIEKGLVYINGKKAVLGDKVEEGDKVEVKGGVEAEEKAYYAFNKPIGVVTVNAQKGETEILDTIKFPEKVYPVGRLDKETEGLILFTNDGRLVTALLDPKEKQEKEYSVVLDKSITHQFIVRMANGVDIGVVGKNRHYKTKKAKIRKTGDKAFDIIITEGKNRQIRRMCGALGYKVKNLRRFRIAGIQLGSLKKNQFRRLKEPEIESLFGKKS